MLQEGVFKAYDIRGIYGEQLNEVGAQKIGYAFVKLRGAKKIAVGRDMRDSSPAMAEGFISGALAAGAAVVDIGQVSTPMLYFAVGRDQSIDGGVIITASHNPAEYTGMKLVGADVLPIGKGYGMEELKELALSDLDIPVVMNGDLDSVDVLEDYINHITGMVDLETIKPMNIVIDAGNGVNGPIIREVLRRVPQLNITELYFEPDGNFPNHEANPLKVETLEDMKKLVLTHGADLGFAFDGDGDRVGVMDEMGNPVAGDFLTALLAKHLLQKGGNASDLVHYDLRSSWIVPEYVELMGGQSAPCMVGHALIKNMMKETGAFFAGELSNHFYFNDFYRAESADLVLLLFLSIVSTSGKNLSELVAPLRKYYQSGEINSEVADKQGVMDALVQKYQGEATEVSYLDGIRLEFEDFWFNVRPSNTEPLLRLNLEARAQEVMEARRDEILAIIRG
jgi:phosphomannomutase